MTRHVVTACILLAALGCYAVGFDGSALSMVVLGATLELWFWVRTLRTTRFPRFGLPPEDRMGGPWRSP